MTAFVVANRYAPEHLILQIENARARARRRASRRVRFLGPWTPESVGDYCSGTNHVLPTYGFARSYSSLGRTDFLRSMTVQELVAVRSRDDRSGRGDAGRSRGPRCPLARRDAGVWTAFADGDVVVSDLLKLARPDLHALPPYSPGAWEPG